ncbi:MAG: glycosyltransferase family 4 protein [Saprospiraceae bacterium]
MKLGFHYHIPAFLSNGNVYTMDVQGLFIDSLAPHCEKIILFLYMPIKSELNNLDYKIQSSNVELVPLIKHYSIPVRLLLSYFVLRAVDKRVSDIDILLMRAPTPLLPLITKAIKDKIKFSYLVVGEMIDHIDNIPQAKWRKGFLRKYILWNEYSQQEYAKEALVFSNSAVVHEKYEKFSLKSALIRTTTLKKTDFFFREDTCLSPPYQILFTGRIERGKGILEIVEAIGMLNQAGINCELNVVGWSTPGDDTIDQIKILAKQWNVFEKVKFHGKKKIGVELFGFYKNADIFALASQVAEGFPRTIWEALAHSLPVISTNVGSIGSFLKDGIDVLLVEQRNASDIAEKTKSLIKNSALRKTLIENGLKIVNEVTLEIQGEKICNTLKDYIRDK